MTILLLLIPLSLMLVGIAAWAFAWAVRRGQFDDLDTPALDILGDDDSGTNATPTSPSPTSSITTTATAAAKGDGCGDGDGDGGNGHAD